MKANSEKTKQSKKATRRVLAGVLCGASVLSLVLSLVMPPISQAIANDSQADSTEETVMGGGSSSESTDVDDTANGDTENQNSDDAEGGETGDGAAEMPPLSDDTEAESAAQPADDGADDENAIALASGNANGNIELQGDVTGKFTEGGSYCLTSDAWSTKSINIKKDTKINLAGHKLYYRVPKNETDTFITVESGALTIEDYIEDSGKSPVKTTTTTVNDKNPGQPAEMEWTSDNNGTTPQSLTYYETTSTPKADRLGTTETTTQHTVSGFGAIVAASKSGSVKQVISVADGSTLNLNGGMITTPRTLGNDGHVILSQGAVNISGGYVTNGNGGGWGGGLCITGAKASLEMTDGVVAGNKAASGGGIFANNGATLKLAGGIISGNATYSDSVGLGGGILVSGGSVTVSGGYITNNKYAKFCGTDGNGCHGGAGLAANSGVHVTISGGQITGNYSEEAGGGVYVTNLNQGGKAWLNITEGIIASNVSYRSEGAGIRVGQKVDALINGPKDSNGTKESIVYITNNHCMSRFDWGGGGIFVQGDSKNAENAGRLFVYNSYISSNTAGGYGGGVAVCPSGKTLVTNTKGTAIFGNKSAGKEYNELDGENYPNPAYNKDKNSGNDRTPHLSAGNDGKDQDKAAYLKDVFRDNGHADFFLAAHDHETPIAVVTGEMLGGGDARYSGSIELKKAINIPANGAVGVKKSIGLTSGVMAGDEAAIDARNRAQNEATTFITGNYSWDHGGGIMSNGDLYLGVPADAYAYPSLKLKATKELDGRDLKDGEFTFTVYRKDSDTAKVPSWKNDKFDRGDCEFVKSAQNSAGNIAFDLSNDLSKQLGDFSKKPLSDTGKITYSYYLVENAGNIPGVVYDHAVYEINVTVKYDKTVLMSVPIQGETDEFKNLNVYNFTIDRVDVTKNHEGSAETLGSVSPTDDYYLIADSGGGNTFTNKYDPEVSWTPEATKVVEGGEMKEFTLQLAEDSKFNNIIGTAVTSAGKDTKQTLSFKDTTDKNKTVELKYSLSDIRNNSDDPGGSTGGSSKTFTYYVRENDEHSTYPHYKFDPSVYRFKVVATDNTEGGIDCAVTYRKGTVNPKGEWTADASAAEGTFTADSIPTFTNTYSTSLPLSGMSGVTLTYLAGAAVLCAAAAWMHIRRKANAKGGERRE